MYFIYPLEEQKEAVENQIFAQIKKKKHLKATAVCFIFSAIIIYFLSSLITKFHSFFIIMTAISAAVAWIICTFAIRISDHYLFIEADEDVLKMKYFDGNNIVNYMINYSDIIKVQFTNDDYSTVMLAYNEFSKRELAVIKLNVGTPEQAFFLYTIEKLLPEAFKADTRKIGRKFGSEETFYREMAKRRI